MLIESARALDARLHSSLTGEVRANVEHDKNLRHVCMSSKKCAMSKQSEFLHIGVKRGRCTFVREVNLHEAQNFTGVGRVYSREDPHLSAANSLALQFVLAPLCFERVDLRFSLLRLLAPFDPVTTPTLPRERPGRRIYSRNTLGCARSSPSRLAQLSGQRPFASVLLVLHPQREEKDTFSATHPCTAFETVFVLLV